MRRLLTALAVLAFTVPAPASGHPRGSALVVTGNASGYATLRLDQPVALNLHDARVTRDGTYGGLVVEQVGFVVTSQDIPATTRRGAFVWGGVRTLQPGTYKLYLVSDGAPVRVEVPWSLPTEHVHADTPNRVEFRVETRNVTDGAWHVAIPDAGGRVGTRVYGMSLYESRSPVPREVTVQACLTRSENGCAAPVAAGVAIRANVTVNGLGAGFGSAVRDTRGYHVVGRVQGALPLDHLTLIWLRYHPAG